MRHIVEQLALHGLIKDDDIEGLMSELQRRGDSLHKILRQKPELDAEQLAHFWMSLTSWDRLPSNEGVQVHLPYIDLFGVEFSRLHGCIVLEQGSEIVFAGLHPFSVSICDDISLRLACKLKKCIIFEKDFNRFLEQNFSFTAEDRDLPQLDEQSIEKIQREISKSDDLLDMANKAPVVRLINGILFQALQQRSSDIHLQPYEDHFIVRYRIDGMLKDAITLPKSIQEAVCSRIKVMGKMDIAERRLPQDGTTSFLAAGREVDVRISSLPSIYGERLVLRLQDKSGGVKKLEDIGLSAKSLIDIQQLLKMSHGMILVTGPTGAGKTTTLYAMLDRLNEPDVNIITLEDPVELVLPGISQIQVAHKKGLTFATGLRSIVRQDPDVIMVGEIRDLETARISIQSALTGHLVLSTLHTNDAVSAITRLVDLGVEPTLINASVLGVIAQRLVRTVCAHCKTNIKYSDSDLQQWDMERSDFAGVSFVMGRGCSHCNQSGYYGRTALYEILLLDQVFKAELHKESSYQHLFQVSVGRGMSTLRADGIQKIKAGLTTPEEVFRVTQLNGF